MPKVLVGASVRRDPVVLEAHLKTLEAQILPPDVELRLMHVDDFTEDQRNAGRAMLQAAGSDVLSGAEQMAIIDFDDTHPQTHIWQQSAFERVAKNKQLIFDRAVKESYDYVWILDTDLILDPMTLWSMYYADKPVVAAVYWTRWQNDPNTPAGPQVWLRHPYQLDGRGMDQAEFRSLLAARNLLRVWGLGACMLLRTDVLRRGVRYWPLIPELVAQGGMMAGEDRTFCVICERLHISMYADAWPDILHIYHQDDIQLIDGYLHELGVKERTRALKPNYGDYVSLQILPLEDQNVPAQHLRGRIGQLKLLPELEAEVLNMSRGDRRLVRLAFPLHYGLNSIGMGPQAVQYRGTSKVVQVTMIDHKPYGFAPVLRDEMQEVGCFQYVDRFLYTPEQLEYFRNARPQRT